MGAVLDQAELAIADLKVLSVELNQICPSAASSVGLVLVLGRLLIPPATKPAACVPP